MEWLLLFYFVFSGVACGSLSYYYNYGVDMSLGSKCAEIIFGFLFGWLIFPCIIGRALSEYYAD